MGEKWEGGVKNLKKWVTSFMDDLLPLLQAIKFREQFLKIELFSDYSQLSTSTIEFLNHKSVVFINSYNIIVI